MKTAEEILKNYIPVNGFVTDTGDADYSRDECISAMIEYADQFKQKLDIANVVGRSEQFVCDYCENKIDDIENNVVLHNDCYNNILSK